MVVHKDKPDLDILRIEKLPGKAPEITFVVYSSQFTHTVSFDRVELESIALKELDLRAPTDEYSSYNGVYTFNKEEIKKAEKRYESGKFTISDVFRSNNNDLNSRTLSFKFTGDTLRNPVEISFPDVHIMYDIFNDLRIYFKAHKNRIDINGQSFVNHNDSSPQA